MELTRIQFRQLLFLSAYNRLVTTDVYGIPYKQEDIQAAVAHLQAINYIDASNKLTAAGKAYMNDEMDAYFENLGLG